MTASEQQVSNNVEEATKPVASPIVKPVAQPTNVETAPSNPAADTQQQFIDLERWNASKQQQAQKRIIEHLMYSGRPEETEAAPTAQERLKNKLQKKQKPQEKGGKNNNKKKNEFDVEKTLRSVLGSDYRPQKGKGKNKKKRNRRKKNKQNQQPQAPPEEKRVKTEQERLFRTASNPYSTHLVVDLLKEVKLTVHGRYDRSGFEIPELNMSLEATSLESKRQHIFLSNIAKENLHGLTYQSDECVNISCATKHCDTLLAYLDAWTMLTEPESVEPLKDDAAEAPTVIEKVDDEEDSQDEEEPEGYMLNEFGEDNNYVWFENDLMLHVTSHVGPEDTLSYSFSKKEKHSERGVFSYIPKSSPSFLKKNAQFLNTGLVILNCNHLTKMETIVPGEICWPQIQSLVLENPDTYFILTSFDSSIPHTKIYEHFGNLVAAEGFDLSNVVLFLPPPTAENQI